MNGSTMIHLPDTNEAESNEFIKSMQSCPKSGLHNPFKNKERYLQLGEVNRKVVEAF